MYIEGLGWIATVLLLIGYYLNARKQIMSWIIWMLGNGAMLSYALLIGSDSVAFLSFVLILLNVYGFISWRRDQRPNQ